MTDTTTSTATRWSKALSRGTWTERYDALLEAEALVDAERAAEQAAMSNVSSGPMAGVL